MTAKEIDDLTARILRNIIQGLEVYGGEVTINTPVFSLEMSIRDVVEDMFKE